MSQPESLRLADAWDAAISTRRHVSIGCEMADELRRLITNPTQGRNMTETQRKALQAAEEAFRRYADHHAMKGDETKARANMALAGQMAAALSEPEPADTPTGWLYTNVRSMRKKYIAHRAGLPEALLDLDPVALYSRPQR